MAREGSALPSLQDGVLCPVHVVHEEEEAGAGVKRGMASDVTDAARCGERSEADTNTHERTKKTLQRNACTGGGSWAHVGSIDTSTTARVHDSNPVSSS